MPANASHCETCAAEEIAEAELIAKVQKALTPYVVSGQVRPISTPTARYIYGTDGSGRELSTTVQVRAILGDTATIAFPTAFRPHLDSFRGEKDHADGTRTVSVRSPDA